MNAAYERNKVRRSILNNDEYNYAYCVPTTKSTFTGHFATFVVALVLSVSTICLNSGLSMETDRFVPHLLWSTLRRVSRVLEDLGNF